MNTQYIEVLGAKEHNLKNIDLLLPKNKLVVITGVSGSGKSSLAFDTIYAEGQRRYMETFSTYARQFMGKMERPHVDSIQGLSPVVSIEQKTVSRNPRSTVGTITEIYDFMRLLFARLGVAYSPATGNPMKKMSEENILNTIQQQFKKQTITILGVLVRGRKGHYRELFEEYRMKGFLKVRINGIVHNLVPNMQVDRYKIHNIELVIDKIEVNQDSSNRLSGAIQEALKIGKGIFFVMNNAEQVKLFSQQIMCDKTGIAYEDPSPNTFSFNSPYGWCEHCKGLGFVAEVDMEKVIPDNTLSIIDGGIAPLGKKREASIFVDLEKVAKKRGISLKLPIKELSKDHLDFFLYGEKDKKVPDYIGGIVPYIKKKYLEEGEGWWKQWAEEFMTEQPCKTCNGGRLKSQSLMFKIKDQDIASLSQKDIYTLKQWFQDIEQHFSQSENLIAKDVLIEIRTRLDFLLDVGLHYLTLNLPSKTLSGGEAQRIRLATQISSQLQGITYILDEPSIGLHQRDNHQLIQALKKLRDIGNTILVVEHDKDIMLASDYIIDIGPGAGKHGGKIVAEGTPQNFIKNPSLTSQYLNHTQKINIPTQRRQGNGHTLELIGAKGNNLKNIDVTFPLGTFIGITGVSGSGKSTLIGDTLYPILYQHTNKIKKTSLLYSKIKGVNNIDKVIEIDQTPIGRTPRSNPATYCSFFTDIRDLFAALPEAKARNYKVGRFSFNVKGGRCEECEGAGIKTIEMGFLPDVYTTCTHCQGKRYNRETLDIRFKGKSIYDVLEMTIDEAVVFFQAIPSLYRKMKTLQDVGLGYISLGQSAVTLSGGEAQRIKLATELSKRDTGKTFYILDEPTTGLHFKDINLLIQVLNRLVDKGNTVLVIEHNLDLIKVVDHIIDLGPEGGKNGGYIVAQGTPEDVIKNKKSITGQFLKNELT